MVAEAGSQIASGKYELVRALGRGGMGEVFLARDTRLNRQVAIKYLRGDLPEGNWRDRLQREAQLLAQINHPNIVQIYDIVDEGGVPALVMEYVDGRNLHIHLREHRVELQERLRWLTEIASGIAAFHAQGIVHRDLKPENVLISPAGTAKVSDFGIADDTADRGADITALGRLAEEVLADYRQALSPLLVELLADLTRDGGRRQPSAQEAHERLRLAWYESAQQETPLPEDYLPKRRRPGRAIALAVVAASLAAAVLLLLPREAPASRYVAVAPPRVEVHSDSSAQQARYLRSAVSQSLGQNAIDSPGLSLVSYQQSELADDAPAALLETLGLDSLLVSSLSCSAATCDFTVERLDAPDAAVAAQVTTTLLIDSVLDAASFLASQWPNLFPDAALPRLPVQAISDRQYRAYLDLYVEAEQGQIAPQDLVPRLEALLDSIDQFVPLYLLYARAAIDAYEFMGDTNYLDRLQERLETGARRVADPVSLDRAWFDLYKARGDVDDTARTLEAIVARDPDPALENFLRGQLRVADRDFPAAAQYFERATSLQPSSTHYYAWARSQFFANDKAAALATLDAMLARYPNSTRALNLKGAALFQQWRLDEAAAAWETNLAIQDDAMVRTNLGSVYLFLQDYPQARAHFQAAYDSDSRDAAMLLNLADSEQLLGNAARARELYREIVDRFEQEDPNVAPELAAQAYAQLGRFAEALTVIRQFESQWQGLALYAFSNALVYTLAGQEIAAVVEVSEALGGGLAPGFFSLPWFDALCGQSRFVTLLAEAGDDTRCAPAGAPAA